MKRAIIIMLILFVVATPAMAQTPTPPDQGTIQLPSGQVATIYYTWSFGEIVTVAMLIIANVLYAARFIYDVIYSIWDKRKVLLDQ